MPPSHTLQATKVLVTSGDFIWQVLIVGSSEARAAPGEANDAGNADRSDAEKKCHSSPPPRTREGSGGAAAADLEKMAL